MEAPRSQGNVSPWRAILFDASTRARSLIILSSVLTFVYAIGVVLYVRSLPSAGIRCAFSRKVNYFDEKYLFETPNHRQTLAPDDLIVQLGDQPVQNWAQLEREYVALRDRNAVANAQVTSKLLPAPNVINLEGVPTNGNLCNLQGATILRVWFVRDGKIDYVWCRLGKSPLESLLPTLLWLLIKAGLFVVGAFVFWNRPRDVSARQFFVLTLVSCGAYIGGYHWMHVVTEPILLSVFMVCSVLLPAVSLHFYLLFPRPKSFLKKHPTRTLVLVYLLPCVFLVFLFSGYLNVRLLMISGVGATEGAAVVESILRVTLNSIFVYFGIALLLYLLSITSLVHSFRKAEDQMERNQVWCILVGALAALLPLGYSFYLALMKSGKFGGGGATWPMFCASLVVTIAFTIAITRYGLMHLEQLISSSAIYFAILVIAGLTYYALVLAAILLLGSQVVEGPSFLQVFGVSGTVLVLLLVLDQIRGRVKRALDRHFQRRKHQLDETLHRMSAAISQLVDAPTLGRRLLLSVTELLGVERGAVFLRQGDPPLFELCASQGDPPELTALPPGCPLLAALSEHGMLMSRAFRDEGAEPEGSASARQLRFVGGEVACALTHENEMLAALVLGAKRRGHYVPEDLNLLSAFAQVTALALVSGEGGRQIVSLNRELQAKVAKIAEQQRRILQLQSLLSRTSGRRSADTGSTGNDARPAAAKAPNAVNTSTADAGGEMLPQGIIGSSSAMSAVTSLIRKVAASSSAVLLRGESGTGKELLAEMLHRQCPRSQKPFVKVHCAALAPTLLESELFGHTKGAFTGAVRDRPGRFELADGGTLFLDEIGDVSLEVQTKLLRVLQEMAFERVGSSEPIRVDVRIVAATHQNLELLIEQGRFREDLFYRLNVLPIVVPPLRERREDVPELVQHFLAVYGLRSGKPDVQIDDDALILLREAAWPGNVRQLENVIERAVIVAEDDVIQPRDLPEEIRDSTDWREDNGRGAAPGSIFPDGLLEDRAERKRRERELLVRALAATSGNKAEAARALGLARSTFISRLKKHGLS